MFKCIRISSLDDNNNNNNNKTAGTSTVFLVECWYSEGHLCPLVLPASRDHLEPLFLIPVPNPSPSAVDSTSIFLLLLFKKNLLEYSYFQASLVAEMVKNLPAMQETWVRSLGLEDPLEEGMETHSSCSWLENPHGQRSLVGCSPWGCKESDMTERLSTAHNCFTILSQFLLYSKVNQLYVYIYIPSCLGFPFHLGHHRALSRVPCAVQ